MDKLISIIIPCYKVEEFLPRCLDSVIGQTYKSLEIILVDDGSPDKSGEICDTYAKQDSRIVVVHQKNKGLSGARNSGIDIAKGEYLYFLDSDDAIFPDTISDLVRLAEENDADIVSAEYCSGKEPADIKEFGTDNVETGDGARVLDYILNNASWNAWGRLYRKDVIGGDRFLEGHLYEDFEFVPRQYLKAGKCVHFCRKNYFYFVNDAGIMGGTRCRLKTYWIDFAEKNLKAVRESNCSEEDKERLCAGLFMHYMWDYTKPLRSYGVRQDKEFRIAYRRFVKEQMESIKNNEFLDKKYKTRFRFILLLPDIIDMIYKLSYSVSSRNKT